MRPRRLIPAILATLTITACSATTPPTAASLAARIPGCAGVTPATPSALEQQDVTCLLPDNAQVEIATFATPGDEAKWIADGGTPATPDPASLACCIQGNGWAATAGLAQDGTYPLATVAKALGGRQVTG